MSSNAGTYECTLSGDAVGSEAPTQVCLIPWGLVSSRQGEFLLDEQSAEAVVGHFREHGVDLVIDYEHQSLGGSFSRSDGQAPAAGWIKALRSVPGVGLVAEVQWTEPAAEQLARRQYRYLSPVVIVRKSDRRAVELHSVALTNTPAMENAEALVNRRPAGEDTSSGQLEVNMMMLNELKDLLQLEGGADEAAVMAACRRLREERDAAVALRDAVLEQLELSADSTMEQVEARLMTLANPPDKVPAEQLAELQARLDESQSQLARQQAVERVTQAMSAGKITENQRHWALSLALKDAEAFEAWVSAAPVVVTTGRMTSPSALNAMAGDRAAAIAHARASYGQARQEGLRVCSLSAWVNDELREAGQQPLTEKEVEEHTLVI